MSHTIDELEKSVINIWAKDPDWSQLRTAQARVTRIVIGEIENQIQGQPLPIFEADFSNLKQLHIWNVAQISNIPTLPDSQIEIDLQNLAQLTTIANLPLQLESISIENCGQLKELPDLTKEYSELRELRLINCPQIPEAWINRLIEKAPHLITLDLSGSAQLKMLTADLPRGLERLELNRCENVEGLPDLPKSLRRLGLKEAKGLRSLVDSFCEFRKLDYVDLSFTTKLRKMPKIPASDRASDSANGERLRTLFLFGSGVIAPPASEHGESAESNVAESTRDYFSEVELVGKGDVRRCKLLFLGNGKAGKTSLATCLHPLLDPDRSNRYQELRDQGSTHGIQFLDAPKFQVTLDNAPKKVNLHLWDFGGQEIYHSTHRLFVSRGSVFIIVWDPNQDGKQPESPDENGYTDVWHAPRYWLDYIRAECPHTSPMIAVVCADHDRQWVPEHESENWESQKQALKQRLFDQVGKDHAEWIEDSFFVIDSIGGEGETSDLQDWIGKNVALLIESEGTSVPKYWDLAQQMIEQQLDRLYDGVRSTKSTLTKGRLSIEEFHDQLVAFVNQKIEEEPDELASLAQKWEEGKLLSETRDGQDNWWRIERTLSFLTHSGWVYWSPKLFESRVIVDQPWALELVYRALERRKGTDVFRELQALKGRFRLEDLQKICWKDGSLNPDDQKLILSFMESVGVCFRDRRHWWRGDRADLISPVHLPESEELVENFGNQNSNPETKEVPNEHLHRGHWNRIMRALASGQTIGDRAEYTRDAILIDGQLWHRDDRDAWKLMLQLVLDTKDENQQPKPPGLGGKILISAVGEGSGNRIETVEEFVKSFLPGYKGNASTVCLKLIEKCPPNPAQLPGVFFSYAWDDPNDPELANIEESVDLIYQALEPYDKKRINLLRDKSTMRQGDFITDFVSKIAEKEISLVIVFASAKYWRSWYCMAEFDAMCESLMNPKKSIQESVLVIQHPSGKMQTIGDKEAYKRNWTDLKMAPGAQYPENLPLNFDTSKHNWKKMRERFVHRIENDAPKIISNAVDLSRAWNPENSAAIVKWVKQKLGLPVDKAE